MKKRLRGHPPTPFGASYIRFAETVGDLWSSIKFYFCELFGIVHTTPPTVEKYSEVMKWNIFLPGGRIQNCCLVLALYYKGEKRGFWRINDLDYTELK